MKGLSISSGWEVDISKTRLTIQKQQYDYPTWKEIMDGKGIIARCIKQEENMSWKCQLFKLSFFFGGVGYIFAWSFWANGMQNSLCWWKIRWAKLHIKKVTLFMVLEDQASKIISFPVWCVPMCTCELCIQKSVTP